MDAPERVTYFGSTDFKGKRTPFGIKQQDRSRHMYVVGKTGTGKSTLLENMMVQDAKNGEGFACIDTHGASIEKLLDCIPQERIDDVVYVAPHLQGHALAFNVLEDVPKAKQHIVVATLMPVFKSIWADVWNSKFEYVLSNVLLVLLGKPNAHLLEVYQLFTDRAYRQEALLHTENEIVKHFFTVEFEEVEEYKKIVRLIVEKVHHMSLDPIMCAMLGQAKSSMNMREVIDSKRILLVHIPKGLVGEANMKVLGSLFSARIFLAIMSRADAPLEALEKLPLFSLYADEFQNISGGMFAHMLSEARKYKLGLVIANQYMHQLAPEVLQAILGNVGSFIMFRSSPNDVEILKKIYSPTFSEVELANIGLTQMYVVLTIDGVPSSPFTAFSIPPIEKPLMSYRDKILTSTMTAQKDDNQTLRDLLAGLTQKKEEETKHKQEEHSAGLKATLEEVLEKAKQPVQDAPFEVPEQTLKDIFKKD
jgi:hypothetical protein